MASKDMNLVFLLLVLLVSNTLAEVFLSIDCGSSDTLLDVNSVTWSPDAAYVKSGQSQEVASLYATASQVINTMRVFKTGTTNCYSINVVKGEQVLVRASFYYGNYDNKLAPPTFDIQLNGKYWATVVSDVNLDRIYYFYEAIIVVQDGDLSVCLVQTTNGQYPFISALEVRSLDANMYSRSDSSRALYKVVRFVGSNTQTVSYPDDIYDRVWSPTLLTPTIPSDTLLTIAVNLKDNPPIAAFQEALTSSSTSIPIKFSINPQLPSDPVPVLINMYFAELVQLDVTDKRSFDVYIDNERLTSTPITPSYGIASEWTFTNISASSTTEFSLKATSDSTMPPILNAIEIYTFSGDSTSSSSNNNNNNNNNDFGNGNNNESNPTSNSSKQKKKSKTPAIVGGTVSGFVVIWAIVGLLIWQNMRKSAIATALKQTGGATMPSDTPNSEHHIMEVGNNTSER